MTGLKRFKVKIIMAFGLCIASFLLLAVGVGMVIEDENNRTFTVTQGKDTIISVNAQIEFYIKIESNITTGFSWNVKETDDLKKKEPVVKFMGKKPEEEEENNSNGEELMGAPGFEILIFKALKPGKATIELEYKRPWEKDVKPEKTQKIIVTVQ